jgi:hypothetical protein
MSRIVSGDDPSRGPRERRDCSLCGRLNVCVTLSGHFYLHFPPGESNDTGAFHCPASWPHVPNEPPPDHDTPEALYWFERFSTVRELTK